MTVADSQPLSPGARLGLTLTIAASLGPLLWFSAQLVLYAYTARDCAHVVPLSIWSVLAGAVLLCTATIFYLCRLASRLSKRQNEMSRQEWRRTRLMVFGAIALDVLSLVLLLSFAVPIVVLRPCA